MEGNHSKKQTKVLKKFSRRPLKRKKGIESVTNGRLSFDGLQLSGKKPEPATINSLQKDITTALKENVDPETQVSQNVDDFWEAERQKRLSAVARRRLTGVKPVTQPVEGRQRPSRSRRDGSRRLSMLKKVDEGAVADWDKESLEEEEERPCTIASSQSFMAAQETALRASLPLLNSLNRRVEAVSGASSPTLKNVSAPVDEEPKEQTPQQDKQDEAKSSDSLEDMELSTGDHSDSLIQKNVDLGGPTPDLASLVEMEYSASPICRVAFDNAIKCFRDGHPVRTGTFVNHGGKTPHAERECMPASSPTPPTNPLAAYMLRRRLTNEIAEVGGRRLEFDSSSPCSSIDMERDFQMPDFDVDWDKITADDDCYYEDLLESDHQVDVASHQREDSEEHAGVVTQSQESCSLHLKTSSAIPETQRKSGSNLSTEPMKVFNRKSPEVDSAPKSVLDTPKMKEAHREVPSGDAEIPSPKGQKENTRRVDGPPLSPIKSIKSKLAEEKEALSDAARSLRCEGKDTNSLRASRTPVSARKSVKNNNLAEKIGLSSAARALSFEVAEMEAIHDDEKVESLVNEPQEAVEPQVILPDNAEENASQPCGGLESQHAEVINETQTCVDQRSEPEEISAEIDMSTDPQSQVVNISADNIQAEQEQAKSKRRMKESDQTTAEVNLCTDQQSQVEEFPAVSVEPEAQEQQPKVKRQKKKDQKKRCSLEGAENGLVWKDGLRRSQRRRTRPLEWWRGEKLLYGRIHDSLTTVIGIKQSSPGAYARGDRVPFAVESFVPAKYNDLIRLAAM
ncbi:hypothetical protein R1flu_027768 [Riccia fluitans]|uniref:Centromere protein C n=1 Tax=Riccia fluitans TaxID=41844 RepID=A0ABD1XJV7_9MARC